MAPSQDTRHLFGDKKLLTWLYRILRRDLDDLNAADHRASHIWWKILVDLVDGRVRTCSTSKQIGFVANFCERFLYGVAIQFQVFSKVLFR